jgi:N-acetylglucosamine kinase-like BadF-type ATPase
MQKAVEAISGEFSRCPACAVALGAERAAVTSILSAIANASDLQGLSALCLPHISLVIASADPSVGRAIIRRASALLRRTNEDMRRYSLKHDALRRDLVSDEEQRAYRQALQLLCGHMNCVIRTRHNDG